MRRSGVKRYLQALSARVERHGGVPESQPNILLLMTDQQRWDAMGCSGGWVKTPVLDRIAVEGVRFTNAYTNSPVCIPARVSLATGKYPHQHHVWDNRQYFLSPKAATWMQNLRDAGYRTSVIGKIHLYPQKGDLRDRAYLVHAYGLDDIDEIAGPKASLASRSNLTDLWEEADVYKAFREDLKDRSATKRWVARPSPLPLELYPDVYVGRRATEYLRNYDRDQPWFCWVSFPGPHEPWDAPEPYASHYEPEAMPSPAKPMQRRKPEPRGFLDERLADPIPFEEGDVARMRANYAGNISLIDDQIAGILRVIEERGELDRTVVAFVSDHGEMNGDHGLIYKKTFLNGGVRIPFLVRLPAGEDLVPGAVSSSPVELMDIGATFVELAGGRMPKGSRARSLVPTLEDPGRAHRSEAVSGLKKEIMVATTDWRMAVNRDGQPYVLVDLQHDPDESVNLIGDPEYDTVLDMLFRQLEGGNRLPRRWRSPPTGDVD